MHFFEIEIKNDATVSLETLSLKGTKVTPTAVKGIRDRFPYSLLKSNASFLGFWPLAQSLPQTSVFLQARVRARRERHPETSERGVRQKESRHSHRCSLPRT
jgi:hypothetical protein